MRGKFYAVHHAHGCGQKFIVTHMLTRDRFAVVNLVKSRFKTLCLIRLLLKLEPAASASEVTTVSGAVPCGKKVTPKIFRCFLSKMFGISI